MIIKGSEQLGDPEGIALQLQSLSIAAQGAPAAGGNSFPPDNVSVSNFTQIALLAPPRDQVHLAQLQQMVNTGEYGPPASSIAEALITQAILMGVSP